MLLLDFCEDTAKIWKLVGDVINIFKIVNTKFLTTLKKNIFGVKCLSKS